MKKLFRYIESKYEDWFDYMPSSWRTGRYEAYVRFLGVMPLLVLLFIPLTVVGIFISNPNRFLSPFKRSVAPRTFVLQTEGNLRPDSVRVDWNMVSTEPVIIFERGIPKDVNYNRQGYHFFRVYYNGQVAACFEQFKGDNDTECDYRLHLARYSDGELLVRLYADEGKEEIEQKPCY